jgi:hypothetical protein
MRGVQVFVLGNVLIQVDLLEREYAEDRLVG